MLEQLVSERRTWARRVVILVLAVAGVATLPIALPVFPVDDLIAYQRALGFTPRAEEHSRLGALPQYMADRFGWKEMASAVERAYLSLPPEQQRRTRVFTRNYGEAAAIDYFSPVLRDRVLSGHNNYYLWFPGSWVDRSCSSSAIASRTCARRSPTSERSAPLITPSRCPTSGTCPSTWHRARFRISSR